MIINNQNLRTLGTGFNAAFKAGFAGADTFWAKVAMETKSSTSKEEYGWLGQFPQIREWLGDRVINNLSVNDFSIKNRDFESTVAVPRNNIMDDNIGIYGPMFNEMGRNTAEHPDHLMAELILAGDRNICYDGQYFFDADHPVIDANGVERSVSNWDYDATKPGAARWYLIDNTRMVKPFIYQNRKPFQFVAKDDAEDDNVFLRKEFIYGVDGRSNAGYGLWQLAQGSNQPLTPERYEINRRAMQTRKGDFGKRLGINPALLVVPPELERAARRLINSATIEGSSNEWAGTAELVVVTWLGE